MSAREQACLGRSAGLRGRGNRGWLYPHHGGRGEGGSTPQPGETPAHGGPRVQRTGEALWHSIVIIRDTNSRSGPPNWPLDLYCGKLDG